MFHQTEEILSEDQVSELLERHLRDIGVASDEQKVSYLTQSMLNSFCSEIVFETKDFYLSLLHNMSSAEIRLLKLFYMESDPFSSSKIGKEPAKKDLESPFFSIQPGTVIFTPRDPMLNYDQGFLNDGTGLLPKPETRFVHGVSLEGYLKDHFEDQWQVMSGACASLDRKGLTAIKTNFDNTAHKEVTNYKRKSQLSSTGITLNIGKEEYLGKKMTAFESSKTELGIGFIKFITESL